jgi:hypothetical protein
MKRFSSVCSFLLATAVTAATLVAPAPARAGSFNMGPCLAVSQANLKANSYRSVMNTNYDGRPNVSTVDIQKPDRVHVTSPHSEIIAIGKKTWMRSGGGPWKLMPNLTGMGDLASINPAKEFKPEGSGSCVDAGTGTWKGQPAHLYRGTSTNPRFGTVTDTMYQLSDGYIHHVDANSSHGKSSFDFTDFNSINISPPN